MSLVVEAETVEIVEVEVEQPKGRESIEKDVGTALKPKGNDLGPPKHMKCKCGFKFNFYNAAVY